MLKNLFKFIIRRFIFLKTPVISSNEISLFSSPEGFKFFFQNYELTKNVGLNCSWKINGKVSDSTKFLQKQISWTHSALKILKYSPESGVTIFFHIQIKKQCVFNIKVKVTTQHKIKDFKIILMLNPNYKNWIADIHEGSFPSFKAWLIIGTPVLTPKFIGVKSLKTDFSNNSLIPVIMTFNNFKHSIENADNSTKARLLTAKYNNIILGEHKFNGKISFFPILHDFNQFILNSRKEFLLEGHLKTT